MSDTGSLLRVRLDAQTEWELTELTRRLRATRSTVVRMAIAQMAQREGVARETPTSRGEQGKAAA